jgi:hypothetical protein
MRAKKTAVKAPPVKINIGDKVTAPMVRGIWTVRAEQFCGQQRYLILERPGRSDWPTVLDSACTRADLWNQGKATA